MIRPYRFQAILLLAVVAGAATGCSSLSSFNPFIKKEEILPGERSAVFPQAEGDAASGTPAVGAASGLSDWSQPGGTASNAPGNVALASTSGTAAWRTHVIQSAGRGKVRPSMPPLVYGGRIFVYDAGGIVSSLSPGGGDIWTVKLAPEGEKSRTPGGGIAAAGNAVYAATPFSKVFALDLASGNQLWEAKLSAPARSAPTAADGKVFVVSATNVLHAINQADGSEAWQYSGIPESAGVLSSASPAVSGNTVVVPYSSGEVVAFDAGSGETKWADTVIRSSRTMAVSGINDVAASPVINDGVVYATGVSGRTIALSLSDGERIWEQSIGSASTPAVSGNAVFLVDLQDNIVALERSTGKVFWRTALPVIRKKRFFSVWTGPTLAGNLLWAVSNDRRMVGVDPGTGNIVVDRELPKAAYIKPIAAGGQLLILASDGSLAAYQ